MKSSLMGAPAAAERILPLSFDTGGSLSRQWSNVMALQGSANQMFASAFRRSARNFALPLPSGHDGFADPNQLNKHFTGLQCDQRQGFLGAPAQKQAKHKLGKVRAIGDTVVASTAAAQHENSSTTVTGYQTTVGRQVSRSGVGLHSGTNSVVTLLPAKAGSGRRFLVEGPDHLLHEIPVHVDSVSDTRLSTTLRAGAYEVQTVEHLLSALQGLGVHNVDIRIKGGSEVPLLDGSASGWVAACEEAGIVAALDLEGRQAEACSPRLQGVVTVHEGDSWVAGFPANNAMLTCGIHFPQVPAIGGPHWYSYMPGEDPSTSYATEVAPARTFGVYEQFEQLRAAGLIKGGSLENALVCSVTKGWVNPPLRFPDEPCRHKLLDLMGDLALAEIKGFSGLPAAHIVAYKASHTLHVKFVKALLRSWR